MKLRDIFSLLAVPMVLLQTVWGQEYVNLDFEAAQFIPIPGDPIGAVVFSNALPGWTGLTRGQTQTAIIPNGIPIGTAGQIPYIAILAPPLAAADQGLFEIILGTAFEPDGSLVPVSLTQTGLVPLQAKSLRFLQHGYPSYVFLGGQQLDVVPLGSGPGYSSVWGADISGLAGRTLELRFQAAGFSDYLDAITFSSSPIPEPSTISARQ